MSEHVSKPPSWLSTLLKRKQDTSIVKQLETASVETRETLIVTQIDREIRKVLGLTANHPLDNNQGFFDMGMDSLMTIELYSHIKNSLGKDVALRSADILQYNTVTSLSNYILELLTPTISEEKVSLSLKIKHELLGNSSVQNMDNKLSAARFWSMYLIVLYHYLQSVDPHNFPVLFYNKFIMLFNNTIAFSALAVFIMIAGRYAKNIVTESDSQNMILKMMIPYFILNVAAYIFYSKNVTFLIDPGLESWFLLAYVLWSLTIPFASKVRGVVILSVFISLLVGMADIVETAFSASRYFYYFPFFIFGYLYGEKVFNYNFRFQKSISLLVSITILIAVAIATPYLPIDTLYGLYPYHKLGLSIETGMIIRLAHTILLFISSIAFIWLIPKTSSIFSSWGTKSLYVYITHLFFLLPFLYLGYFHTIHAWYVEPIMIAFTFALTIFLSTDFWYRIAKAIMQPNIGKYIFRNREIVSKED